VNSSRASTTRIARAWRASRGSWSMLAIGDRAQPAFVTPPALDYTHP
jgi:hypothetical protein